MRHGTAGRRSRHRGNGRRGGGGGGYQNNRAQVFDSNGPDVRIRGTAYQIQEKYATLAKDCVSVGDLVMAESYFQHAEHYQRVINAWNEQHGEPQQRNHVSAPVAEHQDDGAPAVPVQSQAAGRPREDLGLPASILGPARESVSSKEDLADA